MLIFADTANIEEIKELNEWGVIAGVTTNPTLVAKEEGGFHSMIKEICSIVSGPVSAEVLSLKAEEMVEEARTLAALAENVVIKIPLIPEGLKAIHALASEGIKTNATLVFSANQALLAARAGAAYVSPFVGRMDDIGNPGMEIVKDIVGIFRLHNINTRVIAASIRHPMHVMEAAKMGADIATVPYGVITKMIKHPMTDLGIERFLEDWKKVRKLG